MDGRGVRDGWADGVTAAPTR